MVSSPVPNHEDLHLDMFPLEWGGIWEPQLLILTLFLIFWIAFTGLIENQIQIYKLRFLCVVWPGLYDGVSRAGKNVFVNK